MFLGMFSIFIPLALGYLISIQRIDRLNALKKITSHLVFIILSLMGLGLAKLDDLATNINQIMLLASCFFIFISGSNLLALPLLDCILKTKTDQNKQHTPFGKMAFESLKLVFVVLLGFITGLLLPFPLDWVTPASEAFLLILLFFIGIELRNCGLTLKQIILNKKGVLIALVVLTSSLLGGLLAAWVLNIPSHYGLAMASGFGWYSLAGILVGDALGPVYGGASFLLELTRELLSIILIPLLIHRYPLTAIGYSGATAMDFTLPIIQSTGGVRCVPIAIVSGFILSALVPLLILFFISLSYPSH